MPESTQKKGPGRPLSQQENPATARSHLGGILRSLRTERGLTLMRLGGMTGYSWQHLGAIERGQVAPSETVVAACEHILAAGGQLTAAFPAVVREQASHRHKREAARRNQVIAPGSETDWSRLASVTRQPSVISTELVEELEEITNHQRILYHELSSTEMLISVEAHLNLLVSLMRGTQPEPIRHRVASAAVEAAGFAAWLWFDLGDQFKMGSMYELAAGLLEEAGNPALGSYISGYRALAAEATGPENEAVAHGQVALQQAPVITSKLARSWLSAVAAKMISLTGDRQALKLLGQARDYLETAHDKEDWMFDFDRSTLAQYGGYCHIRLSQPRQAMIAFEAGIAELPERCDRRRAFLTIGLAEACLQAREPDVAVDYARQALPIFAQRGSTAGLLRVNSLRGALARAGYRHHSDSLDQEIRSYLMEHAEGC